jgi:dihydroorotase
MNLLIKNGRVIDPSQNLDAVRDVLIQDGRVARIGENIESDGGQVLDASGLVVSPGLIDVHVHGRTPGQEYKEDTASLTLASARGGVTTVCVMPNTEPAIDRRSVIEDILHRARTEGNGVRVLPIASVSIDAKNESLSEFADMKQAGAVAVSDDAFPVQDMGFLRRVFQYARTNGLVTMLHCEDTGLTRSYDKGGATMSEGVVSNELGLRGAPPVAEEIAVFRACALAREEGARVHILHVSTQGAARVIREAKAQGVPVTAEVCPHHFALTHEACRGYNTDAKMNPPLRTQKDVDAMIEGLKDGTFDIIATDHAPHAGYEKEREFAQASFGIIGVETSLATSLKYLQGHLSLPQIIEKMTSAPAQVLGLEGGTLREGSRADVTVFDPDAEWVLDAKALASKSKNTPFDGATLRGVVHATVVGGEVVYKV